MIVLVLLGAASLAGGLVLAVRRRGDVVTGGRVVGARSASEGGPVPVNRVTVALRDEDGEDVTLDVRSRAAVAPGTAVTVRRTRTTAASARIETVRTDLVLMGAGAVLLVAGLVPQPSGLLLAGAALFGSIGGWMLRPRIGGVKVRGTVVRVDTRRDDDGDLLWRPVIRYYDRDEREQVVEYDVWTNGRSPQVGAPQTLWYRPEDPGRILIGSGMVLGGVMAGLGAGLAVAALVVLAVR